MSTEDNQQKVSDALQQLRDALDISESDFVFCIAVKGDDNTSGLLMEGNSLLGTAAFASVSHQTESIGEMLATALQYNQSLGVDPSQYN